MNLYMRIIIIIWIVIAELVIIDQIIMDFFYTLRVVIRNFGKD